MATVCEHIYICTSQLLAYSSTRSHSQRSRRLYQYFFNISKFDEFLSIVAYLKEALRKRIGIKSPEAVFVAICKEGRKPEAQQSKSAAIANQIQGQAEQSNSASLSGENQVSGFEPKDCDEGACSVAPVSLNQSEIFEWLDRANLGECPPLWVIQYLLDSKYYASMRATISKFEKQWNISVVNYQVQKSSDTIS
ncbi:hypothetical protein [Nostoc sp.]|uniref:hypothetical protein n=1 Tax=Nostoc sp. TaxID=1180 RepID=UPI002FFB7391